MDTTNSTIKIKDSSGDEHIVYPITRAENIIGLVDVIQENSSKIDIDDKISFDSENPVQNKVIASAIEEVSVRVVANANKTYLVETEPKNLNQGDLWLQIV